MGLKKNVLGKNVLLLRLIYIINFVGLPLFSKDPQFATTTTATATEEPEDPCQYGGFPELVGNGVCNDENNNEKCNWDGGDCCGEEVNKEQCIHCKW